MLALKQLRTASATDLPRIASFLRNNGLPTKGVKECLPNFVLAIGRDGGMIGVAGFEQYGEGCLLRSVAVDERYRGQGYGRVLVQTVLRNAEAQGVKRIYLLTDDASDYFKRLGFEIMDREHIDEPVKASVEFTELCPQRAIAMRKTLS